MPSTWHNIFSPYRIPTYLKINQISKLEIFISDGYKVEDAVYFWNDRSDNTSAVVIPSDLSFLQYEMSTLTLTEKNNTYNSGMSNELS